MAKKISKAKGLDSNYIFRGDSFFLAHADYFYNEKTKDFRKRLRVKNKRIDSDDFTYRIINHWEKHGLIESEREGGTGWRKICFLDGVWLHILNELRAFGLSIEIIKKIKHNLKYLHNQSGKMEEWELFEFYIAHTMIPKDPVYFLAFRDGTCELATHGEYNSSMSMHTIDNHIQISINEILQRMYPNKDLAPKGLDIVQLSEKEMNLLTILRLEDFDTIKVRMKNGKMNLVEIESKEETTLKLNELLAKSDYQDITFSKHGKKSQTITRKEKRKL